MNAASEYRYHRLTWPQMNDAIAAKKVVLLPTGSTEQHGPHLPLEVDVFLAESAPYRFPRDDPYRARGVHRFLSLYYQERGLPRLREDLDRQRPRIQLAAGRSGRAKDGAGNRLPLRRAELLQPGRGGVQQGEGHAGDGSRRRVRDLAPAA